MAAAVAKSSAPSGGECYSAEEQAAFVKQIMEVVQRQWDSIKEDKAVRRKGLEVRLDCRVTLFDGRTMPYKKVSTITKKLLLNNLPSSLLASEEVAELVSVAKRCDVTQEVEDAISALKKKFGDRITAEHCAMLKSTVKQRTDLVLELSIVSLLNEYPMNLNFTQRLNPP